MSGFEAALEALREEHRAALEALREEHEAALEAVRKEHEAEHEELRERSSYLEDLESQLQAAAGADDYAAWLDEATAHDAAQQRIIAAAARELIRTIDMGWPDPFPLLPLREALRQDTQHNILLKFD